MGKRRRLYAKAIGRSSNRSMSLPGMLQKYANSRAFEYFRYSEYHMRIIDDGYTTIDVWTTEKYWVKETNYHKQSDRGIVERAGEKGYVPTNYKYLEKFLDKLFFAAEME